MKNFLLTKRRRDALPYTYRTYRSRRTDLSDTISLLIDHNINHGRRVLSVLWRVTTGGYSTWNNNLTLERTVKRVTRDWPGKRFG